jgi:hypothetical protein
VCQKFTALAASLSEALLPAGEIVTVIRVELTIMCHKKRGEPAADIARAIQIPEMIIHTILKSAQKIETRAVNLLNHSSVKITCRRCCDGGLGVGSHNTD